MKINSINSANLNPYARQQAKVDQSDAQKLQKADKLEISSQAKEMQESSSIQAQRQEKLDQLKLTIENGTYQADPKQTAADLLKHFRS
ncbi:flagellar biosynthesis anti-sigma factor FlgM [Jeotgalibacillus proteolyticus]|uniref:flagellar biosynthesis anti-sigma factor FlgM n=1 Tax=Jeotgalibacillus proteolyticus TaxID=2082395 RepID=UPI003CF54B23